MASCGKTVRAIGRMAVAAVVTIGVAGTPRAAVAQEATGVLLLAHGGDASWNGAVSDLARRVNERMPIEVAFGMAQRAEMQAAVDRLVQRGVKAIVAVPLFVSSHSSLFESTAYLLGARQTAPPQLAIFAKMKHGGHGSHAAAGDPADAMRPVTSTVPIRMGGALDDHQVVVDIVTTRARSISRDPASEVVIVVAHGPTADDENAMWLKDMDVVAKGVGRAVPFARVERLTVRDDAPAPIRDAATAHLRDVASRAIAEGRRVLIVPLVLAYGGIEGGIRTRLDGVAFEMARQGLLPDDRFVDWILAAASKK